MPVQIVSNRYIRYFAAKAVCGLFILFMAACVSPKPEPLGKDLYNPAYAIEDAMTKMTLGNYRQAEELISRALLMNPRYFPAYIAKVKLALDTGLYEKGFNAIDKAHDILEDYNPVLVDENLYKLDALEMRLIIAKADYGWYDRCFEIFQRRVAQDRYAAGDVALITAMAEAAFVRFKQTGQPVLLDRAEDLYAHSVVLDKGQNDTITAKLDEIQKLQVGTLKPGPLQTLARKEIINREEFVRMVDIVLGIGGKDGFIQPVEKPDVRIEEDETGFKDYGHLPSAGLIVDFHRANTGVLRIEKGRFYPDKPVLRKDLAFLVEKLYEQNGSPASSTRLYFGKKSPYYDMKKTQGHFNAMMLCLAKGYLQPVAPGRVAPDGVLEGGQALSALRFLHQDLGKMADKNHYWPDSDSRDTQKLPVEQ